MRVVRTRRGARLLQGGLVLSEVRAEPGPTNTLFDVLAATIAGLSTGPRAAVLGFAAGGIVAPLRAMGWDAPLSAVDLDLRGEGLFRHLSGPWVGSVVVDHEDAVAWLQATTEPFDVVLDDLSRERDGVVTKPRQSLSEIPRLAATRLTPRGVFVSNLLPIPGVPWTDALEKTSQPWRRARVVQLADYENRVVLAGPRLDPAAVLSRRLRAALRSIGSNQAERLTVRGLKG